MTEVVATITHISRLRSSASGNPRFKLWAEDGGCFVTQSDASVNYNVENLFEGSESVLNQPVTLTLSSNGRVIYIKPKESS